MPVEALASATGTATMEITVSKSELLKELTATQGVVERKTTIPILSNYLFEASSDKLSLTATDLDLSLRTVCNAKVKEEGKKAGHSADALKRARGKARTGTTTAPAGRTRCGTARRWWGRCRASTWTSTTTRR